MAVGLLKNEQKHALDCLTLTLCQFLLCKGQQAPSKPVGMYLQLRCRLRR
jgi:hypothetical protein